MNGVWHKPESVRQPREQPIIVGISETDATG